jgi:hypothetical protein
LLKLDLLPSFEPLTQRLIAFLFPKLPEKEKILLMEEKLKEMQAEQPAKK